MANGTFHTNGSQWMQSLKEKEEKDMLEKIKKKELYGFYNKYLKKRGKK